MGAIDMGHGASFPVSDYYRNRILDAVTIARGGGWWTAVLVIRDPKTEKPFLSIYRWQLDGDTWKTRKSIAFKSKNQVQKVLDVVQKLAGQLE